MVKIEEEQICEDKVSIVKVQADELTKKDQYIEQLQNKIKFLQNQKNNVSFQIEDDITEGNNILSLNKTSDELSGGWSPTSNKTPISKTINEENQMDIDEEIKEGEEEEIEYKRIKYKGERYYIVVGEDPQIVYNILEDEDVGSRIGIRKKKTKGTGYIIEFD